MNQAASKHVQPRPPLFTRQFRAVAFLTGAVVAAAPTFAAETGVGFYLLGSKGPGAGIVPPPGVYVQNDLYFYSGSADADRQFPVGGEIIAGIDANAQINLTSALWSTPWQVLGGNVAFTATLPFGAQDVSASAFIPGIGLGRAVDDDLFTLGDPVAGAMIGWHSGNLHWNVGTLINVPIGNYQEGEIANLSFNHWGVDISGAATWLDPTTGLDISGAAGFTFNAENPETDYRTGTEFHAEWAISKAVSQDLSLGIIGYYYKQISGDSGDGARLGDFKGQVAAIGGTVGYNFMAGSTPVSLRAKIYREFSARNRLEGTAGYLTVSVPLNIR
ncbi:SphA family protein [Paracoccus xiamenensis]|uniref:SphA family protein n=1 Tax=Paracoccus xiamenensis TaxID=2714901 RepID=UPI00140D8FB4|nr:transporter [Paracoccus xiamenensis]NHF74757.1 transporter [Paracoccus xiamenensis]